MVNDHVLLNLDPAEGTKRRTLWRSWYQLSRLQRNLLHLLFIALLVALIFTISSRKLPYSGVHKYQAVAGAMKDYIVDKPAEDHIEESVYSTRENIVGEADHLIETLDEESDINSLQKNKFKGPQNERQAAVVAAFVHAWKGYKKYAWGHDMLKPISKKYHNWFSLGLTIVDALDTMYIMKLDKYYQEARGWVEKSLNFDIKKEVNLFEVTIRVLGGLLGAYHLSNDQLFLEKAHDLGTRLLPCFNTESGVPFSDINLSTMVAHAPAWTPDSSTSEVTTIQLEFRDLSRCTGNPKFEESAARVSAHVHNLEKLEGLVPTFINAQTGNFQVLSKITLGARADSYYEYLLKQWIQTGQTINYLKDDYVEAINGVRKLLLKRTSKNNLAFIGELLHGGKEFVPKMDHLTCYLPGTLALGVLYGMPKDHMALAEDLLYTCYVTYALHPTFLAPEISYFNIKDSANDIRVKNNDAHNMLRPEFVESLWVMYQITGNTTYQEWGWQIFQAFEKYAKVPNGYTSIGNVKSVIDTKRKDMMESFFLAETLKYLYLLFSNDRSELSLLDYVLNSEAHPLPIYSS